MSEEEKTHVQLIEDILSRKLRPFYILVTIVVGLFGIIAVPIASQVIALTQQQGTIELKISEKIGSDEAYRNFLLKGVYHLLQKYEHESDMEAIANPDNSAFIYMKNNSAEAEQLEISSRGATNYKDAYQKAIQNQK
jgi:hypothetical protein